MIIKKKEKKIFEILHQVGFRIQEKGLCLLYFIIKKKNPKIGILVTKKKIRGSLNRNSIKRKINFSYKKYRKYIIYSHIKFLFFFWDIGKLPSLNRIKILIKKIFHHFFIKNPFKSKYYKP